ncbi:dynactin subunit [Anaeramoeba ignava]|uniref:Dynactin subunit n=1 Tax=Anaeramoeba ignava TaxID=1746090 RepID=A0A9Q0R8T3_ANAIG|nr:dynactin subunit [Anaeramoeba ignava]
MHQNIEIFETPDIEKPIPTVRVIQKETDLKTNENENEKQIKEKEKEKQTEFEIISEKQKKFESPLQRYQRLQFEVSEFLSELEEIKKINENKQNISTVELSSLLQNFQKQFNHYNVETFSSPINSVSHLKSEIEQFKEEKTKKQPEKTISYELKAPNFSKSNKNSEKFVEFEKRIAQLENEVGINKVKLNVKQESLVSTVLRMKDLIKIGKTQNIIEIEKRIESLNERLDLFEKHQVSQKQEIHNSNISEMEEMCERWEIIINQLPLIILRLKALKICEEERISLKNRLEELKEKQSQIENLLSKHNIQLKEFTQKFTQNIKIIEENIRKLDSSIASLTRKK